PASPAVCDRTGTQRVSPFARAPPGFAAPCAPRVTRGLRARGALMRLPAREGRWRSSSFVRGRGVSLLVRERRRVSPYARGPRGFAAPFVPAAHPWLAIRGRSAMAWRGGRLRARTAG